MAKRKKKSTNKPLPNPKISVVVFSYNFEKFIAQCLQSILDQTLQPYEIIVCDDCSTDKSWEIIQEFKQRFPTLIRAYRHKENIGHVKNGVFGKDQVKGTLVSIIDGDDYWLPGKLEKEWLALKKNPKAKVAYSNVNVINENGKLIGSWLDAQQTEMPSGDIFIPVFAKRLFPNSRSVYRNQLIYTDVMREVGYGDENIKVHVDWDLKIRLAAKYQVAYSDGAYVQYRDHSGGIHHQLGDKLYNSLKMVIEKNIHLLKNRSVQEQSFVIENLNSQLIHLSNMAHVRAKKFSLDDIVNLAESTTEEINMENPKSKSKRTAEIYLGENLIFLISQPRAGSTMLQRILGSHSKIHTLAEPWIMLQPLYALKEQGGQAEFSAVDAQIGLKDFMANLPNGREDYLDGIRAMAGTWYNRALQGSGKSLFLDKTPRYYNIIPELIETLPEAKYVILLRNPLAVLSSILKTWVNNDWARLQLHINDLLQAPQLLAQAIENYGDKLQIISYEDFVQNPQTNLHALLNGFKVGFEEAILNYGSFDTPKGSMGDTQGVQQHQKPALSSLEKWKTTFTEPIYKLLAEILIDLTGPKIIGQLGYDYNQLLGDLKSIKTESENPSQEEISAMLTAFKFTPQQLIAIEPLLMPYLEAPKPNNVVPLNTMTNPGTQTDTITQSDVIAQGNDILNKVENPIIASAIVSTYASERFIRGCLDGLVKQTLYKQGKLEIIVIDANSPQDEQSIVKEFQQNFDHIKFMRTEERETVYQAWNRGIKMASGKYITNANTDDRLKDDAIEKLVNLLEKNPDKVLAYGNSLVTKQPNETFENNSSDGTEDLIWPDFDRRTMHSWCYMGPHPVWRKSLHDELGYFDTKLTYAADWEFWLRAALNHDFIHLNEFIGLYYLSDETVSRRGDVPIIEAGQVRANYKEAYKKIAGEYILPADATITNENNNMVLYVVHNFPPFWYGGTENYVLELVKGLQAKGQDVHVLFPHIDNDQVAPELRVKSFQGIRTIQMWYDPTTFNQYMDSGGAPIQHLLTEFFKANNYTFVHIQHAQNVPFAIGSILQKLEIPYAVTLHDFTFMCHRNHLFHYPSDNICEGPEPGKCTDCLFHLFQKEPEDGQHGLVKQALCERNNRAKELLAGARKVTAP